MSGRRAGCSGFREGPNVWDIGVGLDALREGAGFPGFGPDVQAEAGCPGPVDVQRLGGCCSGCLQRLDVQAQGRMSGPWRCLLLLSAFLFIRGLGGLYVLTCIFGRVLLVPDHAQHSGLR